MSNFQGRFERAAKRLFGLSRLFSLFGLFRQGEGLFRLFRLSGLSRPKIGNWVLGKNRSTGSRVQRFKEKRKEAQGGAAKWRLPLISDFTYDCAVLAVTGIENYGSKESNAPVQRRRVVSSAATGCQTVSL
jgi:hypothetical protein